MTVVDTKQMGEPVLYQVCSDVALPLDTDNAQVVTDLVDTMRTSGLVGLAAPQIGHEKNIFVVEVRKTPTRLNAVESGLLVCINPSVTRLSEETNYMHEGCGSVAEGKLFGEVSRPNRVTLQYWDDSGEMHEKEFDGLVSRVIQHEYDHLQGILFLDRMDDPTKLIDKQVYQKQQSKVKDPE